MVGLGTRSIIERVENGNSRPTAARASALPDTMPNASTLANMAPGLVKVVERGTTSPIDGRAGWWPSPCPDLARGRGGKPPGLLYNGLFHRPRPPTPCHPAPAGARAWGRPTRPTLPAWRRPCQGVPGGAHPRGGPGLAGAGEAPGPPP